MLLPNLKAAGFVFVLCVASEYSGQPGEIKVIIHEVFRQYLETRKIKRPFHTFRSFLSYFGE